MSVSLDAIKKGSYLYPRNYSGIREILEIDLQGYATWVGYDRRTGEPYDRGYCSLHTLAAWAERLATESEIEIIRNYAKERTTE
jgi:hypothetical protein